MILLLSWLAPSLAAPPIPTWSATEVEAVERAEEAGPPAVAAATGAPRARHMELGKSTRSVSTMRAAALVM